MLQESLLLLLGNNLSKSQLQGKRIANDRKIHQTHHYSNMNLINKKTKKTIMICFPFKTEKPKKSLEKVKSYQIPGTYTFKVPPNASNILVKLWSAGGGGGISAGFGGSAGSGSYALISGLSEANGCKYTIVVGAGGAGAGIIPGDGMMGGASKFIADDISVTAGGGGGGTETGIGGAGGIVTVNSECKNVSVASYPGQNGGGANSFNVLGGSTSFGGNGGGISFGIGLDQLGTNPTQPGGGGASGFHDAPAQNGAPGLAEIYYSLKQD